MLKKNNYQTKTNCIELSISQINIPITSMGATAQTLHQ